MEEIPSKVGMRDTTVPLGIDDIREKIRLGEYDMTLHAMQEMAEDGLHIVDVETAVMNGRIARTEENDLRGTTFVVEGTNSDSSVPVGVVGRFTASGRYLVITVYEITNE